MANEGWLFEGPGKPLRLVDTGDPVPAEDEVVVEVAAGGICHSDVGIMAGAPWTSMMPLVLGHEVAGIIAELGPGVTGWAVGDRVAVALLSHPIRPNAKAWDAVGLGRHGGFGHRAIARVGELVRLPDNVSMVQGAAAVDSVTTSYHAVMTVGGVKAGDVVGIIGMGGLGLNAVQIALHVGAEVHGVDINEATRDQALKLGAATVHEDAKELAQFQPSVILDFAGFGDTTADALVAAPRGGTVVVVGLGKTEATISTNWLVTKNIRLFGSLGGSREDLEEVLELISTGAVTNVITEIEFDEIPAGVERLEKGEVTGRLVARVNPEIQ